MLTEPAPAKVNLALHVVGRLGDGRHALESPVAFTAFGDEVRVETAERDTLAIDGPFAEALEEGALEGGPNLVAAARDALRAGAPASTPVAIRLTKRIPVAAGLGGGSADAAATLRALRRLWRLALSDEDLAAIGARLGADVPMCVLSRALVASGAGERMVPIEGGIDAMGLGGRGVVLANPGVPVATADVFGALERRDNASLPPPGRDPLAWLAGCRNDLEAPARRIAPEIGAVLAAMEGAAASATDGPVLARMSGSGATCFALTRTPDAAEALARRLAADHPAWFVAATRFIDRDA